MKKLSLLFVTLILISFLFANCKRSERSPAEDVTKESEDVEKSSDSGYELLTEKEVQNFVKVFPVFKKESEKLGEKFKGSDKNFLKAMRTGKQAVKSLEKLNKTLKPYGFTVETFFETYAKIAASYSMMMMGDMDELYDKQIKQMKETLKNPDLPKESKEDIKKGIKEMEEQKNSEEIKNYRKNAEILKKYKDDLKIVFD